MTRITFEVVQLLGFRSGKCAACGSHVRRRKRFYQMRNPWNKNHRGEPKTREEIYPELRVEIEQWKKTQLLHERCE